MCVLPNSYNMYIACATQASMHSSARCHRSNFSLCRLFLFDKVVSFSFFFFLWGLWRFFCWILGAVDDLTMCKCEQQLVRSTHSYDRSVLPIWYDRLCCFFIEKLKNQNWIKKKYEVSFQSWKTSFVVCFFSSSSSFRVCLLL